MNTLNLNFHFVFLMIHFELFSNETLLKTLKLFHFYLKRKKIYKKYY